MKNKQVVFKASSTGGHQSSAGEEWNNGLKSDRAHLHECFSWFLTRERGSLIVGQQFGSALIKKGGKKNR